MSLTVGPFDGVGPSDVYLDMQIVACYMLYFRGTNIIKTLLMAPKDRDIKLQISVALFIGLNVHTSAVQRNTYWNQADFVQKHIA